MSNEVDATTVQDALYIVDVEGTYTLYITSKLKNKNGTNLKEPIKMTFTIK